MNDLEIAKRGFYAKFFVIVILIIIISRVAYLQLKDDNYFNYSERNSVREIVRYASRGEITDRNGTIIARNKDGYNIMVVPRELKEFDTVKVAEVLELSVDFLRERIKKAKSYSWRRPSVLVSQVPQQKKLIIEEMNIDGVSFVVFPMRDYPYKSTGNIFGYLGEVTIEDLRRDNYYRGDDYIGKTGIEQRYEEFLRGEKGNSFKLVDVHGVVRGDYKDGAEDNDPIRGSKVTSTIDIELQEFGAQLMQGKIGAIVAIEPSTGELLAMVTAPTFDPDSLVGMNVGLSYNKLSRNKRKPLFNRAVMAAYPPGSTFKMANALIALEDNIVSRWTTFPCNLGWSIPGRTVKCHPHKSPVNVQYAIQTSCNAYFCSTFRRFLRSGKNGTLKESFDLWNLQVKQFGFGQDFDTDIPNVKSGFVPNSAFYNKMYNNYWNDVTIISLSIGQGEITATPLHMANFAAILANRGHYFTPHIVREVENADIEELDRFKSEKFSSDISNKHYAPVLAGMWDAVNRDSDGKLVDNGIRDLNICGKSGTAQNSSGEDHSVYIAFAPKENPKIAIAVYVENGGWGNTYGRPIATLMIEKYLRGEVKRRELLDWMVNAKINYPQYGDILPEDENIKVEEGGDE